MLSIYKNNRGNSVVASLVVMMFIAALSLTIIHLTNTDSDSSMNSMSTIRAEATADAAIQYALDKLNNGLDPSVADKVFEFGSFTITTVPDESQVNVSAAVGKANKSQSINADFAKNCIDLNVDDAKTSGKNLQNSKFVKSCNKTSILTTLNIDWNWDDCVFGITCDSDLLKWVTICHFDPDDPASSNTIEIGAAGWINGHSGHAGDFIGTCEGGVNPDIDPADVKLTSCEVDAANQALLDACAVDTGGAKIDAVKLDNNFIFKKVGGVAAKNPGQDINVGEVSITSNGDHLLEVSFDTNLPKGGVYIITATFADGSSITKTFRPGE